MLLSSRQEKPFWEKHLKENKAPVQGGKSALCSWGLRKRSPLRSARLSIKVLGTSCTHSSQGSWHLSAPSLNPAFLLDFDFRLSSSSWWPLVFFLFCTLEGASLILTFRASRQAHCARHKSGIKLEDLWVKSQKIWTLAPSEMLTTAGHEANSLTSPYTCLLLFQREKITLTLPLS